ncbi:hypothetical protein V6N13_094520 [Hibiscus sabdariffa]
MKTLKELLVSLNVELVVGVVEASTTLSVGVPYVMPDQSILALYVASTKVMEPTKTAREPSKGVADLMQQLKNNNKKSGKKGKRKGKGAGNPNISP